MSGYPFEDSYGQLMRMIGLIESRGHIHRRPQT